MSTFRDGDRAIAARQGTATDQEAREELARLEVLGITAPTAQALGHEIGHWLRGDQENITVCTRCDARLYVRLGANPASDGEAICEPCPALSCAPPAA